MINFYELRELVNTRTGRAHPLALEFEAFSYSPNTQFGVIVKTNLSLLLYVVEKR
jgi:hypothetical protein